MRELAHQIHHTTQAISFGTVKQIADEKVIDSCLEAIMRSRLEVTTWELRRLIHSGLQEEYEKT